MGWPEYLLATALLRFLNRAFAFLPIRRRRVVLATARNEQLEGNLLHLYRAIQSQHPELELRLLLEPYRYGLRGKLAYLIRLARGMYYLQTARLFVVDNAYFPIHVAAHRPETTVVQVWHAAGALKRFGLDAPALHEPTERRFLHRNYDYVVVGGDAARQPYADALRTPASQVLALGSPRTDFFFDRPAMADARQRLLDAHPQLVGRKVVLYAPTFRGRGEAKRASPCFDAARLRAKLSDGHALVLKAHPNLDPLATPTAGYDVVIDPGAEINEVFTVADILVTDYSSSIFEWALLGRPLVLLVPDLEQYAADPGLYLDYRTELIGTQVTDTDGVIAAIAGNDFDLSGYGAFVNRHLHASDGTASLRIVTRFLGSMRAANRRTVSSGSEARSDTLPAHVSHK